MAPCGTQRRRKSAGRADRRGVAGSDALWRYQGCLDQPKRAPADLLAGPEHHDVIDQAGERGGTADGALCLAWRVLEVECLLAVLDGDFQAPASGVGGDEEGRAHRWSRAEERLVAPGAGRCALYYTAVPGATRGVTGVPCRVMPQGPCPPSSPQEWPNSRLAPSLVNQVSIIPTWSYSVGLL